MEQLITPHELKVTLDRNNISQSHLSRELGVSRQAVSLWVNKSISVFAQRAVVQYFVSKSILIVRNG